MRRPQGRSEERDQLTMLIRSKSGASGARAANSATTVTRPFGPSSSLSSFDLRRGNVARRGGARGLSSTSTASLNRLGLGYASRLTDMQAGGHGEPELEEAKPKRRLRRGSVALHNPALRKARRPPEASPKDAVGAHNAAGWLSCSAFLEAFACGVSV